MFLCPPAGRENGRPPRNATQEQYDRWLAFQLAKAEDDLPPSEFNRKHVRPSFRRSVSMPERAVSGAGRGGVTVVVVVMVLVFVEVVGEAFVVMEQMPVKVEREFA